MKWYRGLEAIVEEHVELSPRTWYRVGGSARYFCRPRCPAEVADLVRRAADCGLPLKVLGAGANVLVRDEGFDGVVLQLSPHDFAALGQQDTCLRIGAAADLPDVVRRTVRQGLIGLECLAGIPATVGGAVRMNAGGRFGAIADCVRAVTVIEPCGTLRERRHQDLQFSYRRSNLDREIILDATFELQPGDPVALRRRYADIWRYKKRTQPFTRNNAGCMFKNPAGHSAGALIDRAGLKGTRCGGAAVSGQHANFIVTDPSTRTADILALVARIQERVRDCFAVDLELEVDVW